jgi:hypothetical protein
MVNVLVGMIDNKKERRLYGLIRIFDDMGLKMEFKILSPRYCLYARAIKET